YPLSIQVGLHRSELDELTKNCNVEQTKHEISDTKRILSSHIALEEARKAEEAAERERLIGIFGALDVIRIANKAVDEAVNRLLNEVADKVLNEDDLT
ncbi:hypothetical protein ACJX0J_037575, partial [Zea mays]